MIYIFDSIQQEARQLFTTETLFTAPIGAGVSMSADKIAGWGRFNTTSWWSYVTQWREQQQQHAPIESGESTVAVLNFSCCCCCACPRPLHRVTQTA